MNLNCLGVFFLITITQGRGPHHPRGEAVVKRHVHYQPSKEAAHKLTQDVELLHDKEHLQEHLEDKISAADLSKMTDEELEFYYFQVHDSDKNNMLDGLEILQAILHTQHDDDPHGEHEDHGEEGGNGDSKEGSGLEDFDYLVELIDDVLREDDTDQDGYISYPEYVAGRKNSRNYNGMTKLPMVKMIP